MLVLQCIFHLRPGISSDIMGEALILQGHKVHDMQ